MVLQVPGCTFVMLVDDLTEFVDVEFRLLTTVDDRLFRSEKLCHKRDKLVEGNLIRYYHDPVLVTMNQIACVHDQRADGDWRVNLHETNVRMTDHWGRRKEVKAESLDLPKITRPAVGDCPDAPEPQEDARGNVSPGTTSRRRLVEVLDNHDVRARGALYVLPHLTWRDDSFAICWGQRTDNHRGCCVTGHNTQRWK